MNIFAFTLRRIPPLVERTIRRRARESHQSLSKMDNCADKTRYSRSAREILDFYKTEPALVSHILEERGIEQSALGDIEPLETALDAERRRLMHANERRLERYASAATVWARIWKEVEKETQDLTLVEAHAIIINRASGILPRALPEG